MIHPYHRFASAALCGILLLSQAIPLRADLVIADPVPATFENQQQLALALSVGGVPLAIENVPVGVPLAVEYAIEPRESLRTHFGTPEARDDGLNDLLHDYRTYLELWRGEPFTHDANVAASWELPAQRNGNVSITLPEAGPYFMVAYVVEEARGDAAYCARRELPQEWCAEEGHFPSFPHEESQEYFMLPFADEFEYLNSYPLAYGGLRLTAAPEPAGVSNVLFLPGIKGSRLYRPSPGCDEGSCSLKLWEPSGHPAVRQLFLDGSGKSVNADVYARAGDILSEVLSHRLYASFFDDLREAEASGAFGEGWMWGVAAYDWRLSLTDLVMRGARYDDRIYYNETNGVPYIERLLRDLAAASPTGKVSIVAHSNGGLVAKALMQRLGDAETAALVDTVVLVGAPQRGAPQALGAALFGYGEALPFDACADWFAARIVCSLLVDRETARTFAENAPMTYHLLPSESYFREAGSPAPVARFIATDRYEKEISRYGSTIDSFDELSDFALAREGGRSKPAPSDTARANVLSAALLDYARDIHAALEAWMPPDGVKVHQIAGWGKTTISGIEFYEEPKYLGLFGDAVPRYRPTFMSAGDGIVPMASALIADPTGRMKRFWADLQTANRSHADMLEMPAVRTLVRDVLKNSENALPSGIASSEPAPGSQEKLVLFLHSPLTFGLINSNGDYTGLNQNGTVALADPSIEYGRFGEVQYLIAPFGKKYVVLMYGLDEGAFSLDIQEQEGDAVVRTTTIANVPATPQTLATLEIGIDGSFSDLRVDQDQNGAVDFSITPVLGETLMYGPAVYIEPPVIPDPVPAPPPELPVEPDTPTPPRPPDAPSEPVVPAPPNSGSGSGVSRVSGTDVRTVPIFMGENQDEEARQADMGTTMALVAADDNGAPNEYHDERAAATGSPSALSQTASAYEAYAGASGTIPLLWILLGILLASHAVLLLFGRSRRKD